MDDFFENIQAASRSQATIDNYARREKQFFRWLKIENPSCWNGDDVMPSLERVTDVQVYFSLVTYCVVRNDEELLYSRRPSFNVCESFRSFKSSITKKLRERVDSILKGIPEQSC